MTEPPPFPDSNGDTRDDTGSGPDHAATSGAPRWVKVFGIIAVVIVVLFVIMLLTGGGGHGPGRHTGSGPGGHTAPSSASNHGAQSP
jgi:hypothetical protein